MILVSWSKNNNFLFQHKNFIQILFFFLVNLILERKLGFYFVISMNCYQLRARKILKWARSKISSARTRVARERHRVVYRLSDTGLCGALKAMQIFALEFLAKNEEVSRKRRGAKGPRRDTQSCVEMFFLFLYR